MKKIELIAIGLAVGVMLSLTGCCHTQFSMGPVKVVNDRFFWSTDSYTATLNTNGTASITVNKSNTDSSAIMAVAQGVIQGMAEATKTAAK